MRGLLKRIMVMAILAVLVFCDLARPMQTEAASKEYRAFWFAFYDYDDYRSSYSRRNEETFRTYFAKVCNNGKKRGMNRVLVHVRPFGDAMYRSRYFPWSACISGKQGRNPGYDPLKIMVEVAHSKGLKIEAWINPYRVASGTTNYGKLSPKNPARIWHNTSGKQRNVLAYNGALYYNPSKKEVRTLIVRGVKEIVRNYNVDGIHMDDYFYPSFSQGNVRTAFDGPEYRKSAFRKAGKSVAQYRRHQVNILVRRLHSAVKSIRPSCTFGISPAGSIENLVSPYSYYVDINTWLNSKSYVDYICPQIYWGFKHPYAKYDRVLNQWARKARSHKVKLYVGIGVYKAGYNTGASSAERSEWRNNTNLLKNMVLYGRKHGARGFAFFDYSDLVGRPGRKAVAKLVKVLK